MYVRERFDLIALMVRNGAVENLWVRISGMEDKADIIVGACYQLPSQGTC